MVVVKLMGGLGNQMFQYSFGRSLALKIGTQLKLDLSFLLDRTPKPDLTFRSYELDMFNLKATLATKNEVASFVFKSTKPLSQFFQIVSLSFKRKYHVKEKHLWFYKNISHFQGDIYLDGFWQSELFFNEVGDVIRKDFTIKDIVGDAAKVYLRGIQSENSICVHVRKGDYVLNPSISKIYANLDENYYMKVIDKLSKLVKNPIFYVFSDDINWCKKNLLFKFPVFYISKENVGPDNKDHFMLMRECKHFIIANSTFSWWAAWLSQNPGKIIYAPQNWFRPKFNNILNLNSRNIIPKGWIKI